jgi:glycosyltransferase involved in cell wall biosynthesis
MVGDGLLREQLGVEASSMRNRVTFAGWLEGEALRNVYVQHDILVTPAFREVWGLVVNEALAHGLAVVASSEVTSAAELVDNSSGRRFPPGNENMLVEAMLEVAASEFHTAPARQMRSARMATVTPRHFAETIRHAAELALTSKEAR